MSKRRVLRSTATDQGTAYRFHLLGFLSSSAVPYVHAPPSYEAFAPRWVVMAYKAACLSELIAWKVLMNASPWYTPEQRACILRLTRVAMDPQEILA